MTITIKQRPDDFEANDDEFLRRLGAAIAIHWGALSEMHQVAILEQAAMMGDKKVPVSEIRSQLKAFIQKHWDTE